MTGSPGSRPIYSIGAVARMVGVPTATLRTWEERYGLIHPDRSEGGQRLYSRQQVEQLRFVKSTIDGGANPGDAHRLLEEQLGGEHGRVAAPAAPHKLLVLLAERDRFAAEFEEYFLRTEGYDVHVVLDGAEAAEALTRLQPDVAIVELLISGGTGAELCRRIKEQHAIPLLVLSSLAAADEAEEAGADAFLERPIDPFELVSAVKDLLGESAFLQQRPGVPA